MENLVNIWWAWLTAALVLALIEVMAPGFIFLGFALGALAMTAIVLFATGFTVPVALALFAGLSLLGWIALRIIFRNQRSGARFFEHDIND